MVRIAEELCSVKGVRLLPKRCRVGTELWAMPRPQNHVDRNLLWGL